MYMIYFIDSDLYLSKVIFSQSSDRECEVFYDECQKNALKFGRLMDAVRLFNTLIHIDDEPACLLYVPCDELDESVFQWPA